MYRVHRIVRGFALVLYITGLTESYGQGRLSGIQGAAETAGVHGHPRPLPHAGGGSHRRVLCRLHRLLHRLGKDSGLHRHARHGGSRAGRHLCQAARRTAQQAACERNLCLQKTESELLKPVILWHTPEKEYLTDFTHSWKRRTAMSSSSRPAGIRPSSSG